MSLLDLANKALADLIPAINEMVAKGFLRQHFVLVFHDRTGSHVLHRQGDEHWASPYEAIALSKARLSFAFEKPTSAIPVADRPQGETLYSGSVWSNLGFALSMSGNSELQDEWVSQWIATGVEYRFALAKVQHFLPGELAPPEKPAELGL